MWQQPEVGMRVKWNGEVKDTGTIVEVSSKNFPYVYVVEWDRKSEALKRVQYSSDCLSDSYVSLIKQTSYHKSEIEKGEVGEISKIREEVEELIDAENQKNPVMALVELSDIIGAIELFLEKHHPSITVKDLITMSEATKRAFLSGARK